MTSFVCRSSPLTTVAVIPAPTRHDAVMYSDRRSAQLPDTAWACLEHLQVAEPFHCDGGDDVEWRSAEGGGGGRSVEGGGGGGGGGGGEGGEGGEGGGGLGTHLKPLYTYFLKT